MKLAQMGALGRQTLPKGSVVQLAGVTIEDRQARMNERIDADWAVRGRWRTARRAYGDTAEAREVKGFEAIADGSRFVAALVVEAAVYVESLDMSGIHLAPRFVFDTLKLPRSHATPEQRDAGGEPAVADADSDA